MVSELVLLSCQMPAVAAEKEVAVVETYHRREKYCLQAHLSSKYYLYFIVIKEFCKQHLPSSKAAYLLVWELVLGSEREIPAEELLCR